MKKLTLLMAALACSFMAANAQEDTRTVVNEITATNFVLPYYGDAVDAPATTRAIQYPADAPYYFAKNASSFWQKGEDGSETEITTVFTEGTYFFYTQLRIEGTEYRLPDAAADLTVTVDGKVWNVTTDVTIADNYSYVWVQSPDFFIVKTSIPLNFIDASELDYTENYVNTAVQEKDLKAYVTGGTGTYTFRKTTNKCTWLTVSADGIMGGTPMVSDKKGYTETIEVSDGEATATIQIYINSVYPQPADRTVLTEATFTGFIQPVYGAAIQAFIPVVPTDAVYTIDGDGTADWYKKNDMGNWDLCTGGNFEAGIYCAIMKVCLNSLYAHNYYYVLSNSTQVIVDGTTWTLDGIVTTTNVNSYGLWASPEYELKGTSTALDCAETPAVYAHQGRIYGADGARIYDLLGRDVTTRNGLLNGIYVVKTNEKTIKITVK